MIVFFGNAGGAPSQFVRDGYVVYRGIHDPVDIDHARRWIEIKRERRTDVHEDAVRIIEVFERSPIYDRLVRAPVTILKEYLGPDICLLGYSALWINVPKDKNPVLLKGVHSDSWTGTSVNTMFCKVFLTDCDKYNGVTVFPGSHLQGQWPVRNRLLGVKVKLKGVNLSGIKAGDVLVWHPCLLHATTGHSNKNVRISITSRYSSTETPFSSQERALGYRTMSVGPMNTVLRFIGSDYLTPMRTYGGVVAIDKRMRGVYGS